MIELERHILSLLLDNDCVIIPGFGGFVAHHVDARYDAEEQLFLPPLRAIGFNQQLTINDSLLVQSYIETYDMSYPEALRRIEDETDELRQHLENEGSYELNGIGLLTTKDYGHLEFTPCESGILTPCLYGLSSFEFGQLAQSVAKSGQEEAALQADGDADKADTGDKAIVIRMSWVRNAVAVAASLLLFFALQNPVYNGESPVADVQQSAVLPLSTTAQKPVVPEHTAASASEPGEQPALEPDGSVAIEAQEQPDVPAPEFTIVLASQTTRHHADVFLAELQSKGYDSARSMEMKRNGVRVVFGSYASSEEATSHLRELRKDKIFAEAWVMKVVDKKS